MYLNVRENITLFIHHVIFIIMLKMRVCNTTNTIIINNDIPEVIHFSFKTFSFLYRTIEFQNYWKIGFISQL